MPIRNESSGEADEMAVITIDRPERRNALDHDTLTALREAVADVGASDARVLVITGSGTNFCAGADISTVEDGAFVDELRGLLADLRTLPVPVIAAIHGPALGAGTQLALACDLRVATMDATFGIPAAKLGLTVDHFTVHHLTHSVGHSVARAMLVGAEVFDANRLAAVGFVHRLVESGGDVLGEAIDWGRTLSRLAPLTIAAHKVMLAEDEVAGDQSERSKSARRDAWESADLVEGIAAFSERRRPDFQGR